MQHNVNTSYTPWSAILNRRYIPSLTLVSLAVWLHAADSLLVATLAPAIINDIGGAELIAWNIALYEVGSIVTGALGAFLALRYGIRAPIQVAAWVYCVGCVISAAAPSMEILLFGRLLQGLGGGGMMALSFIYVTLLFPQQLIARALGVVSFIWGASAFLGPLIGGFFVAYGSWRMAFYAFALQSILLGLWITFGKTVKQLQNQHERQQQAPVQTSDRVPYRRLALLSASVISIAYAGVDISIVKTSLLSILGLILFWLFIKKDHQSGSNRLFPKNTFGISMPHSAGITMIFCFASASVCLSVYGTLFITLIHGTTALVAGYIIACPAIGWTIAAIAVSGLDTRHDKTCIAIGMMMVSCGVMGLVWAIPYGALLSIAFFALMVGCGYGTAWTFLLRQITKSAPHAERERISGALPTIQTLGYAMGAAYVGVVANAFGFSVELSTAALQSVGMWLFLVSALPLIPGLLALVNFVKPSPAKELEQ